MRSVRGDELPVGAVRRYESRHGAPIPVAGDGMRVGSARGVELVRDDAWVAGYRGGALLGVIQERGCVATLAACGTAFVGLVTDDATEIVRWDLHADTFEPLARIERAIGWLGCSADASRFVAIARDRSTVALYDANGAPRWERAMSSGETDDDVRHPTVEGIVVDGEGVTMFARECNDDYSDAFERVTIVPGEAIDDRRTGTKPDWYAPPWPLPAPVHRVRARPDVAISADGTRVATARELWTRPEGTPIPIPDIYDSGMASSWGGEASVHWLAFDDTNELLRLCARGSTRFLERCIADTTEPIAEDDPRWAGPAKGVAWARDDRGHFTIVRAQGGAVCTLRSATHPAVSRDGALVAYGYLERLHVLDLRTRVATMSDRLVSPVVGAAFSADGILFTATADGRLVEWDATALPFVGRAPTWID